MFLCVWCYGVTTDYGVHRGYMAKRPTVKFSTHYAKDWRLNAQLTLEEAGARLGRSHATLSRIENRKVALTQPLLDEMAKVYGCARGAILDRPPKKDD